VYWHHFIFFLMVLDVTNSFYVLLVIDQKLFHATTDIVQTLIFMTLYNPRSSWRPTAFKVLVIPSLQTCLNFDYRLTLWKIMVQTHCIILHGCNPLLNWSHIVSFVVVNFRFKSFTYTKSRLLVYYRKGLQFF